MASMLHPDEYIQEAMGAFPFLVYTFQKEFHLPPEDLDDLIDGILYLDCVSYTREYDRTKNRNKEG